MPAATNALLACGRERAARSDGQRQTYGMQHATYMPRICTPTRMHLVPQGSSPGGPSRRKSTRHSVGPAASQVAPFAPEAASTHARLNIRRRKQSTRAHAHAAARTHARTRERMLHLSQPVTYGRKRARQETAVAPVPICRIASSRERTASTARRRCHQTARDHQVSSGLVKMHRTISVPTHSTRASSSTSASADAPLDWTWADALWLPPRSKVTSNTPQ